MNLLNHVKTDKEFTAFVKRRWNRPEIWVNSNPYDFQPRLSNSYDRNEMRKRPSHDLHYFISFTASANEAGPNRNIRVILIVLFVFLGAFITLTLIQVVRRKACRSVIKAKGRVLHRTYYYNTITWKNFIPEAQNIIKIYLEFHMFFKRQYVLCLMSF